MSDLPLLEVAFFRERKAASRVALVEMWDEEVADGLALPWRCRLALSLKRMMARIARARRLHRSGSGKPGSQEFA